MAYTKLKEHKLYNEVRQILDETLPPEVDESSRVRLILLALGIIDSESAAPAKVAKALKKMGLSDAEIENIERRIRRIEHDSEITDVLCFHPFAKERLILGNPKKLILILDPTTQDNRIVMLTAAVWYRGRALPLVWDIWPANKPLEGDRFWTRVNKLLEVVSTLLPKNIPVIWLADRAFGTPIFTDMVVEYGWDYLVRVQGQTKYRDRLGREHQINQLIDSPNQRRKLLGHVFKKRNWREASVVAYWGSRYNKPLLLVSSLPPEWALIRLYRQRDGIEAIFRHYKTYGWNWEKGLVVDLDHVKRLLVGMALAAWLALMVGTRVAAELLARKPTGERHTPPFVANRSLFTHGFQRLSEWLHGNFTSELGWQISGWEAPKWESQIYFHHARAYVFAYR